MQVFRLILPFVVRRERITLKTHFALNESSSFGPRRAKAGASRANRTGHLSANERPPFSFDTGLFGEYKSLVIKQA